MNTPLAGPYSLKITDDGYEISAEQGLPMLRLFLYGHEGAFTVDRRKIEQVLYPVEEKRGYEATGSLSEPGLFRGAL